MTITQTDIPDAKNPSTILTSQDICARDYVSVSVNPFFRCVHASLYEGLSFGPSVGRSVRGSPVFLDRGN